jgi:hypothetical protein
VQVRLDRAGSHSLACPLTSRPAPPVASRAARRGGTRACVRQSRAHPVSGEHMATNKRLTELIDYTSVLPYASEMFGIYQPLLGWKSKRIAGFEQGFQNDKLGLIDKLKTHFTGQVDVHYLPDCQTRVQIRPGALMRAVSRCSTASLRRAQVRPKVSAGDRRSCSVAAASCCSFVSSLDVLKCNARSGRRDPRKRFWQLCRNCVT